MTIENLVEKSKELHNLRDPKVIFNELNKIKPDILTELVNDWQPDKTFKPVVLLRFLIAQKLLNVEKVSQQTIDEFKAAIESRDIAAYYSPSHEYLRSIRGYKTSKLGMFHQWKDPYIILFPFFYNQAEKQEVKQLLQHLTNDIIAENDIPNAKAHWNDFDGPNNYGTDHVWGAIIPDKATSPQDAYQLFFRIDKAGISGGLYKGHRVNSNGFNSVDKPYASWEELTKSIAEELPKWRELNSAIDYPFQKDEKEFKDRISKCSIDDLNVFFQVLDFIIDELSLADEDNLVFSTGSRQLGFHVGKRYCLNLKSNSFYFIAPEDYIIPGVEKGGFTGGDNAAYYKNTSAQVVQQHINAIVEAVQFEIERDNSTERKEYDNAAFRKAAFDKAYRAILFNFQSSQAKATKTEEQNQNDKGTAKHTMPLNQILYGPPGTGKTYYTKQYALQIIEELTEDELKKKYTTREAINKQFQVYQERKQVEFVTFHQSFSYEDFVEGIKPVLPSEETKEEEEETALTQSGDIAYELLPGIFKNICERAESYVNYEPKSQSDQFKIVIKESFKNARFYKMSVGNTASSDDDEIYQYCLKNDCIALGWGGGINFEGVKNRKEIKDLLDKDGLERSKYETTAVKMFVVDMKHGDFVFVSNGNYKIRAIGQVSGGYYFEQDSPVSYRHFRKVKWLVKEVNLPVTEIYKKAFSQQTIYSLNKGLIKQNYFESVSITEEFRKNHVLIIDEINRGNVSQIFGELITLIEPDKRAGNIEQLKVILPYSKEDFSVPANLYLLGTMNTADRSVEALDTALRRRFSFKELAPDAALVPSAAHLFYNLLWRHKDNNWQSNRYKAAEAMVLEVIGTPEDLHAEKYTIWNGMKGEGEIGFDPNKHFVGMEFPGVNPQELFRAINDRIEVLLNRDHCIGHSYFISLARTDDVITELKKIFKDNIIPLLQEYFYGDYGRIGMVLGEGFVKKKTNGATGRRKFAKGNWGNDYELSEKDVFEFTDSASWSVDTFKQVYAG
ncbi:AAA family ATPase [uncultured Pontibacter sp.]|uniref:AAA family ATPase n=1 Tax=uncultured Pontibacter sp. TaxID=453356 RepID=UPI00260BE99D|nr:AAA family ATPase [uncultured Pontibacter sp.]